MRKEGKVITITSSKGGVGKTIFLLNLAGILAKMNQKILLVDCDYANGAIALNLDVTSNKTIFHISDDYANGRNRELSSYITPYHKNIDVVSACRDPRQVLKIDTHHILSFLSQAHSNYDLILVDTTHGLSKDNILLLDHSDLILYMMTNDLMDIKNTKSFMEIMKHTNTHNRKVILNYSRDPSQNYFSKYDIRNMIGNNIDYSIDRSLYIKNITSFLLEGEIFTLNKSLTFKDKKDLMKLESLALDLIKEW